MQQHAAARTAAHRGLARVPWFPLALIVSLFFLWGGANNLNDVLVAQFKKAFTLSDFQAGLVQSAFYLGYFLVALPAGVFMRRFGYKAAVVFGLLLYGAGALLFWPAAATATYATFLVGLFVIAAGLAFLETSANPYVTLLGPRESAASRLNLAQAFNPLGSITGVLIGQHFIFTGVERSPAELAAMDTAARTAFMKSEAAAVQMPYLVIGLGVILWAVIIAVTRFPRTEVDDEGAPPERGVLGRLLRDWRFMSAVVAQFFYVGAQVAVFSYMIRYAQATMPGTEDRAAANFITAGLVCFMVGRLAGAALMKYLRPARVLGAFAAINVALAAFAAFVPGRMGIHALVASSFFMSIMYPTIFALGVEGRSDTERKFGASLLVMSIVGGAVLTAAMGATSDRLGIAHAMVVPMVCFAAILGFACLPRERVA
ncbi:L-fucose:H+ symporter permease [Luteibacter sahnii]|uniref:L-fucose:H+ symporter permease n=1 Tax=Luteibacter sahnii TaxID=3021977 RepID=UPI002A6B5CC7|nr:L-fucose:H+ symporter permease [Luteibacter sp. PPL193]MDY1549552.1 L-fucose:H+ symporter permease [Luteibacter sp. PPL193]